jgi:Tol biopolymer transport system component
VSLERLTAALADRYRIERELGAGGMATVYLATDLKHQRQVAIKVLKPELAAVLGGERFVQEIATTAALQHPNILPLFDSGTADTFLYYVMPYVEGETLRDKLNRETQLGVDEAVELVREVADALHYAHEHGVVHRDIKPENILLHAGRPMVADFGIALAVSAAAGGRMTETGLSLGTPHYMSPEQATAEKTISNRSDVYSLGAVLYEMLAGEPPHTGTSAQQIIMKIVTEEAAPVTKIRRAVPTNVASALARALEKVPADRFDSARAFGDALGNPTFRHGEAVLGAAGGGNVRFWRRVSLALGAAGVLLAAALVVTQWRARRNATSANVVRFKMDLPSTMLVTNSTEATNVAISPDGNTLAYALPDETGAPRLYVRPLANEIPRVIAGTDGAQQPCFSPDGQWIAYVVGTTLWKVQVGGGTPVLVGQAGISPTGLSWSSTGVIVVGNASGLLTVPAGGGSLSVLVKPDSAAGELYFNQPRTVDGGATVLFTIQPTGGLLRSRLAAVSLKTGAVTRTDLNILDVLGYIDGTLVYTLRSGALMAVQFDLAHGRTAGNPIALGPNVTVAITGASFAALSANGNLVYQPTNATATVGWVDQHGLFSPLLADLQAYSYPRLSPDGKRIAMSIDAGGRSDIWLYDIASRTPTRLTNSGTLNDRPEWTPDGSRVMYRADRGARSAIWWQPADLSASATPLQASDHHDFYEGVMSPDGKYVVYQVDDAAADQADIMYRALKGDTAERPVAATRFVEAMARLSPDGKWIAYVTDESGSSQVVVRPFPGPGGQVQVSATNGTEPVWARDGKRIFYRDGRHLMAASVRTTGGFAVTGRTALFADDYVFATAPHANYDVALDGNRFLMVRNAKSPEYIVAYGWRKELDARMQSAGAK